MTVPEDPHRSRPLLLAAVALSLLTLTVGPLGAPTPVADWVAVAFCVLAPGALLAGWLAIRDALLNLVIVLMTGPCLWALVVSAALFAGAWEPHLVVFLGADLVLVLGGALLVLDRNRNGKDGATEQPNGSGTRLPQ